MRGLGCHGAAALGKSLPPVTSASVVVSRRTALPAPMFTRSDFSVWSILKKCIGLVSAARAPGARAGGTLVGRGHSVFTGSTRWALKRKGKDRRREGAAVHGQQSGSPAAGRRRKTSRQQCVMCQPTTADPLCGMG